MKRPKDTDIRKDIAEAIRKAFPDGVIEMPTDFDGSYYWNIHPKLKPKISRIEGAALLYERDPKGGPVLDGKSDPDEDTPGWSEQSSSYYLFSVGLRGDKFKYDTESEEPDENDILQPVTGVGTIGCAVGVSLLAPFATIMLCCMENYESGGYSCPDIEPCIFTIEGEVVDLDVHFEEFMGKEALHALHVLRGSITSILESLGIAVLPEGELRKVVPWLRAGEKAFVGITFKFYSGGKDITVKDAFFFRGP